MGNNVSQNTHGVNSISSSMNPTDSAPSSHRPSYVSRSSFSLSNDSNSDSRSEEELGDEVPPLKFMNPSQLNRNRSNGNSSSANGGNFHMNNSVNNNSTSTGFNNSEDSMNLHAPLSFTGRIPSYPHPAPLSPLPPGESIISSRSNSQSRYMRQNSDGSGGIMMEKEAFPSAVEVVRSENGTNLQPATAVESPAHCIDTTTSSSSCASSAASASLPDPSSSCACSSSIDLPQLPQLPRVIHSLKTMTDIESDEVMNPEVMRSHSISMPSALESSMISSSLQQFSGFHDPDLESEMMVENESEEDEKGGMESASTTTTRAKQEMSDEEKAHREEERWMKLVSTMYRCRECMPTLRDRYNQMMQHRMSASEVSCSSSSSSSSSSWLSSSTLSSSVSVLSPSDEHCCPSAALASSLPACFPVDLIPLSQSYLLSSVSRSFLTKPPPRSAGVIQCYILKSNNRFELFMEMKDQKEVQQVRQLMMKRKEEAFGLQQEKGEEKKDQTASSTCSTNSSSVAASSSVSNTPLAPTNATPFMDLSAAANEGDLFPPLDDSTATVKGDGESGESRSSVTASEKLKEYELYRSELKDKLFRERQIWRKRMNRCGPKLTKLLRTADERHRDNNTKAILFEHAESTIQESQDIFLMQAVKKRAWTGNHYIISMERENSANGSNGPTSPSSKDCKEKETPASSSSAKNIEQSRGFLGKLKSNFGGTEFTLCDVGTKAVLGKSGGKKGADLGAKDQRQVVHYVREAGAVMYDHFFEHTGSPIRIKIVLPTRAFYTEAAEKIHCGSILKQYKADQSAAEEAANVAEKAQQSSGGAVIAVSVSAEKKAAQLEEQDRRRNEENVHANALSHHLKPHLLYGDGLSVDEEDEYNFELPDAKLESYENLRPVWHDGMNAYVLHFDNHRVREKSVKNFKLIRSLDGEKRTVLQFGRVFDRNLFVMDFAHPITPLQAFAISLSSIDPKLAV